MQKSGFALTVCALLASLAGPAGAAQPSSDERFSRDHTLYGRGDWVGAPQATSMKAGERLLVFQEGQAPAGITVTRIGPTSRTAEAKYAWELQGNTAPSYLARLARPAVDDIPAAILAVRRLPASSSVMGGEPFALTATELRVHVQKLPPKGRTGQPLIYGLRYGRNPGSRVVDLFVGYPTYAPKSKTDIKAIRFKRYSFADGRLAGFDEFRRVSGLEERVDTPGPELTTRNWFDLGTKTVGFIRLKDSQTWYRLTIDEGFEGINYRAAALGADEAPAYEGYHYTPH